MIIETKVTDDKLFITVDLKKENFKESRSGKTKVISTGGNVPIQGTELKLGMNVMMKA